MGLLDIVGGAAGLGFLAEAAEKYYEPHLTALGLGKDQIQHQTLQELERSLEKVDDAIARKDTFATARFKVTADGGVALSSTDEGFATNIGHSLLTRKALIVKRIGQLLTSQAEDLQMILKTILQPRRRGQGSRGYRDQDAPAPREAP